MNYIEKTGSGSGKNGAEKAPSRRLRAKTLEGEGFRAGTLTKTFSFCKQNLLFKNVYDILAVR